jgi:choline dehydrogenase-like flavoprotein
VRVSEKWNAIVIGAGLTGSWIAKELSEGGLNILLIDAGPAVAEKLFSSLNRPREGGRGWRLIRGLAGQHTQSQSPAFTPQTHSLYVNDRKNPYDSPQKSPFLWLRGRQVGGRGHTWGRVIFRFGPAELKSWPFAADELEPYYTEVESALDVSGPHVEESDGTIGDISASERELMDRVRSILAGRRATRLRIARYPPGRVSPMLAAATRTGRLTLRPHTVAESVLTDPTSGLARAVNVIDNRTGRREQLASERVFLSASTIETVRLLLNSRAPNHPQGLGNSLGLLGRRVIDHVCTTSQWRAFGATPSSVDMLRLGQESGLYLSPTNDSNTSGGRFGVQLYSSEGSLTLRAFGEMESRLENRIELSERRDSMGVPIARICVTHGPVDIETALAQRRFLADVMQSGTKANPIPPIVTHSPGAAIHESGGALMGASPQDSVVDPLGRLWEASNVWVCDGAALPPSGSKNPTLTLMALALRAARRALNS